LAGLTEEQRKVVEDALVQLEKEHGVSIHHRILFSTVETIKDCHMAVMGHQHLPPPLSSSSSSSLCNDISFYPSVS